MALHVRWYGIRYTTDVISSKVESKGGVYVIACLNKERMIFFPYFTGEAANLKEKALLHLSNSEENSCIKEKLAGQCYFQYAYIEDEEERKGAARYLYDRYKPPCNTSVPDAKPLEFNLDN